MYNPRHILITGASSGLGAALALEYAGPGIKLALHGRDRERLGRVLAAVQELGAEATAHSGNVINANEMKAWIAAVENKQPIDLAIANAGISAGTSQGRESAEQVDEVFATNVGGVINTVQPLLGPMSLRGHGQIAIVSSLAGFRGFQGAPAYCASKAAVRVYGEALRADMAKQKVEINVICPGFIRTPMTDTNKFPMPLLMEADRAAKVIRQGLAANRGRIAFPLPMYALVRAMAALPQFIIDEIAIHTPRK